MKKRLISIGFLALLFGAGGLVYWSQRKERLTELYYCGTMEQLIVTPLKPIELILGKTMWIYKVVFIGIPPNRIIEVGV